ncbi:MAG: hypothetical protein R3C09_27130 [Pirellulaceae bacterium]
MAWSTPTREAVDQIVARLEQDEGRAMSLVMGVIESVPFQNVAADFPIRVPQLQSPSKEEERHQLCAARRHIVIPIAKRPSVGWA